jgi:cytoskeletal protein CcmA (bactofilin family)
MANTHHRLVAAILALAMLVVPAIAIADEHHDDSIVSHSGTFAEDLFESGRVVTITAEVDGGVIVMGGEVEIRSTITGDVVTSGGELRIGDDVAGDIIAAGGRIDIGGKVGGDVTATGGDVRVNAAIIGNVLAMGGRTRIGGRIDGDLKSAAGDAAVVGSVAGNVMLAGGHTRVERGAEIGGNTWIFGGRVTVDGRTGKDVRAAGRHVLIAGEVMGDLNIDALEVTILPTAHIHGKMTYRSPQEADIHADARIDGDVAFIQSKAPRHVLVRAFAAAGAFVFAIFGGLILIGVVQVLLLPGLSLAAAERAIDEPWKAAGIGFAIIVAVPIGIVLLMSTVIGILLGLVIGAAYLIALALGFMIAAIFVGRWGVRRLGRDWDDRAWGRVGMVVLGLVAIAVVALIPFLGALITVFALSLGIGSLFLQTWRRDTIPGT